MLDIVCRCLETAVNVRCCLQVPGDCFCKAAVVGSKCNVCRDGFYNLTQDNTAGCQGM